MRKQMVTLENKAEMLAAQLRQRIGVQRGNILTYHLTGINIEADALQHLNLLITGRIAATNIL